MNDPTHNPDEQPPMTWRHNPAQGDAPPPSFAQDPMTEGERAGVGGWFFALKKV